MASHAGASLARLERSWRELVSRSSHTMFPATGSTGVQVGAASASLDEAACGPDGATRFLGDRLTVR